MSLLLAGAGMGAEKHILFVLAGTADCASTYDISDWELPLLTAHGIPSGSFSDYWLYESRGAMEITGDIYDAGVLPHDRAYYGNGDNGAINGDYPNNGLGFIQDVIDKLILLYPEVDFSDYDNDGDGGTDAIVIIPAGRSGGDGGDENCLWNMHYGNMWVNMVRNGVTVRHIIVVSELNGRDVINGIGSFVHEIGHAFNLPDEYGLYGGGGGRVGYFSPMAMGDQMGSGRYPVGLDPYCTDLVGFAEPILIVDTLTEVTLMPGEFCRINTWDPSIYYYVNNLHSDGNNRWFIDSFFYGEQYGLCVWRIDLEQIALNSMAPNNDEVNPGIKLIHANGGTSNFGVFFGPATGYLSFYDSIADISITDVVQNADMSVSFRVHTTMENLGWQVAEVTPVPVMELIALSSGLYVSEPSCLTLYDLSGRKVWSGEGIGYHNLSNIGLRTGVYLIRAFTADGLSVTKKIVLFK